MSDCNLASRHGTANAPDVPAFVETGDKTEIDTRTGEYRNRVK